MIELKKSQLEPVLILIDGTLTEGKKSTAVGLVRQKITLGTKRRLFKIFKLVADEFNQYGKDKKEAVDNNELEELNNEVVKIDAEKIKISLIDELETELTFDFDLLDLIAE